MCRISLEYGLGSWLRAGCRDFGGMSETSAGDMSASGSNRLLVDIVGRSQFTLVVADDVTDPGGEKSLIVSINFVSSLLWFSIVVTFWRSLLFSDFRRWMSSFWEVLLFLYMSRARTRSAICACMFTIVAGMFRQFSQVQTPTYLESSPTQWLWYQHSANGV